MQNSPSPGITRQELEEVWRRRLEEAHERYRTASARYRKLLEEKPEGVLAAVDGPLVFARHTESETLAEYTRVLKIFTELTVHGQIPHEQSADGNRGQSECDNFNFGCGR